MRRTTANRIRARSNRDFTTFSEIPSASLASFVERPFIARWIEKQVFLRARRLTRLRPGSALKRAKSAIRELVFAIHSCSYSLICSGPVGNYSFSSMAATAMTECAYAPPARISAATQIASMIS